MENNNQKIRKENDVSIISEIIDSILYKINITSINSEKPQEKVLDMVLWSDKSSQDLIYKIFRTIQTEVSFISGFIGNKDVYSCLFFLLFSDFARDFKNNKDLNQSIKKKIKFLEDLKFYTIKSLYETPEITEKISFEEVKQIFISLRERKIAVYRALLEDYKLNKVNYHKFLESKNI